MKPHSLLQRNLWLSALCVLCFSFSTSTPGRLPSNAINSASTSTRINIKIAAASDMRLILDSLQKRFSKMHPEIQIELIFGSSGKLYQQLKQHAPFSLFLSADSQYIVALKKEERFKNRKSVPYAKGRLSLLHLSKKINESNWIKALENSTGKICIANPEHAPYGKKAIEILEQSHLKKSLERRLVYADNVAQTLQMVLSKNCEWAITATSLVTHNPALLNAHALKLPERYHQALIQTALITGQGEEEKSAGLFLQFLNSKEGNAVLHYYGMEKP